MTTLAHVQSFMATREKRRRLPIPLQMSRAQLPQLCRDLQFTHGAEIGVWRGAFSAQFCRVNPDMHWLCVDPWLSYPAWLDTKNSLPPEKAEVFMATAYADAQQALQPFPQCTIQRGFSVDVAKTVQDGSLDLVYIDGNHTRQAVTEDLQAWVPKVRPGGIVSGHDYRVFTNKPTIHVVEAVKAYTTTHQIDPWFVLAADRTPSFLWVVA